MDKKTVFIKTEKGEHETANLSTDLKRILSLIDNKSRADELAKRAPPSLREGWMNILGELVQGGYIRDKNAVDIEPKFAVPKPSMLKMFTPKPAAPAPMDDLDFSSLSPASGPSAADLAKKKGEEAARIRAEMEAAVEAAKHRASAEAAAKAEAQARQAAENAARAKALAEADEASRAETKAIKEAEIAARARALAEAQANAAARMQGQQEASARVRAEIETAARAQQVAEAQAKREAEAARLKAEQEASIVRAELEAAARAKAEAEAALLQAEQEAARVKAELEAAKARAEAEAKALAEARARQMAEEKAKQEAELARLKAEQEAAIARLKAEAEAKARIEAERQAQIEAEAARLKAEQEASIARVIAEAEAKARRDAEAKARLEAETARLLLEKETARIRAENEALLRAAREGAAAPASAAPAYEIQLDDFLRKREEQEARAAELSAKNVQASGEVEPESSEAAARAEAGKKSQDIAAEMARLKEEAEAARRKAEEEARRLAEERALAEEQSKAWAEAEQRARAQAAIEAEQAAQQALLSQAKAAQKPTVRTPRKPLPLGKIVFGLVSLALAAVLVLPYVYPLNDYIAPLEQRLSLRLKQPVHIGGLSAASLPPMLKLQNVTVGNAQEVKIGSVRLNFDPLSLLSEVKVVSDAGLENVSIQGEQIEKQAASLSLLGGDAQYPVRHLTLQGIKIVTDEVALPVFSGVAEIDALGRLSRLALHSPDDKLGFELQSAQGRWKVAIDMKERSLPVLPDVVFNDLSAKGDLGDGEVNFTEFDAHMFNGILLGSAKLNWRKGWQLQGRLEAKTFELDKMFPKFHVEGDMYGEGTFSMTGAKLSQLGDAPRLEGSFTVKKGTVNVDMVETARTGSREHLVGGRTRFDEMIGLVQFENHVTHFRQLKVISGAMSASGLFEVSPTNQLGGNFSADIKMRAANNNLTLYGTLTEPKLRAGY